MNSRKLNGLMFRVMTAKTVSNRQFNFVSDVHIEQLKPIQVKKKSKSKLTCKSLLTIIGELIDYIICNMYQIDFMPEVTKKKRRAYIRQNSLLDDCQYSETFVCEQVKIEVSLG